MDRPVNLRLLSPAMKVWAGIALSWQQSNWFQRRERAREERERAAQMQRDNNLKDSILVQLYKELVNNTTLGGKDTCSAVVLSVDGKYRDALKRVLGHKDFLSYNTEWIEEDSNLRAAFPNMPVLVKFSKKTIQGE